MAEKIKDAEDRLLESLFAAETIADDGFSTQLVRRINRQRWIRRLTLPTAVLIGGSVAFKPLAGLLKSLAGFVAMLPVDVLQPAAQAIPQLQIIVMAAVLLGIGLISARLLQE